MRMSKEALPNITKVYIRSFLIMGKVQWCKEHGVKPRSLNV